MTGIRYANVNVELEGDGLKEGKSANMKRKPKPRPKTASAAAQTIFRESGERALISESTSRFLELEISLATQWGPMFLAGRPTVVSTSTYYTRHHRVKQQPCAGNLSLIGLKSN